MPATKHNISSFTTAEIQKLLKHAKRLVKLPGIDFLLHPKLRESGRILIITPAKIGNAVLRNKIRRRLKALFFEQKFPQKGFDCIAIIKKEGMDYTFEQLKEYLEMAFQKIPGVFSKGLA